MQQRIVVIIVKSLQKLLGLFIVSGQWIHRKELTWDPSERLGVFHCKLLNMGLVKIHVLQDFS